MEDCKEVTRVEGNTTVTQFIRDGVVIAERHITGGMHNLDMFETEQWYQNGKLHRVDGPAEIEYKNGQKIEELWYRNGVTHRADGPAHTWISGDQRGEAWFYDDREYRDDDLPVCVFYTNGRRSLECWDRDGVPHRDNGPAIISYAGDQAIAEKWFQNGKLGGVVLAYIWLADIDGFAYHYIDSENRRTAESLDEFRDAVKGPLALELMRPLPIPIRNAIYEHYCLQ